MATTSPELLRVFVDADVLIAGSASDAGASRAVLQLGGLRIIDLVSSRQVFTEVERNLRARLPAALPAFHLIAEAACRWVEDPLAEDVAARAGQADPKDLPILVAALNAGCSSLVTFNVKDYHPAKGSILIEQPRAFLRRLREHLAALGAR